uniref:Large ribosomal subunit protein uL10m n=1 Tax=Pipistrellus kuhlii TaxID=59472 RepID=A0A7J7SUM8_PIPKU|nr:mitochondrial ribosomal protein L10 [Pipistrellus kuhlii]
MAAAVAGILRGGLLPPAGRLPTLQTVRHGSKAVTRHRRVMHFERQKLMAVTEYIPPKPAISPQCLAPPSKPVQEETGLIRLIRREIAAVFQNNRMIAICQNIPMSSEDKLLMRHRLRKHNILVKAFPNQFLKPFLEGSKYRTLLQRQPLHLTALLDQYVRQQRQGHSAEPAPGQPDPPDSAPDSQPACP